MSELSDISVDIKKSEISSSLNSMIFLAFLMGMYTLIYSGTMYLIFERSSSNRRLVPAALTILFSSSIIQTGCMWYETKWEFIDNGDTRDTVFVSLFATPLWLGTLINVAADVGLVLADGLLIWRCFFVWNRSLRIISVSLFLILAETGLFLVQIILKAKFGDQVSPALAVKFDDVISAAFFTSFGTSIITTVLITYKIYLVSKQEGVSARRFKHIIDIVVQSGALYSLTIFLIAITWVLPEGSNLLNTRMLAFEDYQQSLIIAIPGIAVTILVARVAMLAPDTTFPSTSVHLSGLQFNGETSQQSDMREGINATQFVNVGENSINEGQEVERNSMKTK